MPPPPQLLQRQVQFTQFQFKRGAVLHFFTLSTIVDTCARLHELKYLCLVLLVLYHLLTTHCQMLGKVEYGLPAKI